VTVPLRSHAFHLISGVLCFDSLWYQAAVEREGGEEEGDVCLHRAETKRERYLLVEFRLC
jgi:hypothetical protein